ncbi:MAG: hypothetical protein V4723_13765 [Pseudomonadota bacterium]
MSEHVLEEVISRQDQDHPRRRHKHQLDETLILTELDPAKVVDHLDGDDGALELMTCGSVRETCPKCGEAHLQLILRQRQVRLAHLYCCECQSCFDAHYKNGVSALTI